MEFTQVLLSESLDDKNAVTEKIPVATLLIEDEYHTIYNSENVIGREKSCDIVISNSAISSKHAVIEAEDSDAHLIYDLGSTNKTKLGKMVLKPHVRYHINDGDCVTFGNVSAQYNISRKYLTSPVKGDATLDSCSIPETPERLISTLDLDACENTKQKVGSSSVLELSDTDLFDEKEGDSNLYPKEISSNRPKTSSDIYELDTLSFDENIDNRVKKTGLITDLNKINIIPAKNNVEVDRFNIDPQELVSDDKDKGKNNFGWEDFPEIASPVGLDSSTADNIDCTKFKVSSSFLDITNDDLKSDQHIPKNIGGVILSDLCKPADVDSNKQDISSASNENDLKVINMSEKALCSKNTSIDPKTPHISCLEDGLYSDNDCYIPMSQNIDMFEESPEKTMDGSPDQCDVYEMLTQVSVEHKDIDNINNSIYDIQTQMVIADNDPESKVNKENESSFTMPSNTKLSILEPATQPSEINEKDERNDSSHLKPKVIDETDNYSSFSESVYKAETEPFLHNIIKESESANQNQFDEKTTSLSLVKQNNDGKNCNLLTSTVAASPQPIPEIFDPLPKKIDQNGSIDSAVVKVANQLCPQGSIEIIDSQPAEISEKKESLSSTITGNATQLHPMEPSIDSSKEVSVANKAEIKNSNLLSSISMPVTATQTQIYSPREPQLPLEDNISVKDLTIGDWYEIATQPCRPTSENVAEQEVEKNESTKDDESFHLEAERNSSISNSMYEIATQPCPKDSEKNDAINGAILNSEFTTVSNENYKNSSFSASLCEIATQPCQKDISPEKSESINETNSNYIITTMDDENNKDNIFSNSMCEIATQQCPKDISLEKIEFLEETASISKLSTMNDESNKQNSFPDSMCEIATQPCPKDVSSEKIEFLEESASISKLSAMNDERNKQNTFSDSMCEIATQPCPKDVPSEKIEFLEETASVSKLSIMNDECNQNNIFSDSMCEIATQPCPKDIFPEKNNISDSICEIATQPCPKDIFPEKNGSIDEKILNLELTKINDESNKNNISNTICEIANPPVPDKVNSNLGKNDNLSLIPKVSETSCGVNNVTGAKPDLDIGKDEKKQITHNPSGFSLTGSLPNTLSDSFFEAATQPYRNDQGTDRTYPDPLTSICNDLSDDKIGEISDELMCGNISTKLEDNNKIFHHNKSSKESNQLKKNLETSDNNIYEALADQFPFSSQKNILSSNMNSEKPSEKMSTQDLQRILESGDFTQTNIEFKKNNETSASSDNILNSDKKAVPDDENENSLKSGTKELCKDSIADSQSQAVVSKFMFIDSDSSQELNIRSNKKRCNIFPPDSQTFTNKFLENDDSSQELNIRSNKKRSCVFPSDSQSFTYKFLDNDDSSQELNIRSNKKRCNVFPPDSQTFSNKFLNNEDSSQELNIKSNKKRFNVFPPDSQDSTYKNLEYVSNMSKEESVKTENTKTALDGTTSCDFMNKINDIQKQNNVDSSSKTVSNTSVGTGDHLDIKHKPMSLDTSKHQDKEQKEKLGERISASGTRNSKETKNKSPHERERESNYISRGNITLHSPEVLSELEEQFRLTKVAMSPTQLSVVSDIEDEIQSSQEVSELDKQGIRRSFRNRKNTLPTNSSKNNKSLISHNMVEPTTLTSNENLLKENGRKKKETKLCTGTSEGEKSFKKFKKVSPIKNNTPINEELVKVPTIEAYLDIGCNQSDNSQNSEELGRGKRKRTRPSYEGFIIDDEKKRTSRKKLSFSNSDGSENMNNSTANVEETNITVDESVKILNNDSPSNSIKQTVSVVLRDIKKASTVFAEPKAEKNTISKKKAPKKNETSHVNINKISNVQNSSIKDEIKENQNETTSKDKSCSFSFSEKLDELFNIWGPADRVKLSPRTAKKSYKLLAGGKAESASPTGNKSHTDNTLDKEPKPSSSRSNKNNLMTNENKSESLTVVATNNVSTSRKRNLSQKNEVAEQPDVSKQNKKRRKNNSENSETSLEPDTNDSEVRKSSRITKKKTIDNPVPDDKPEKNPGKINKTSNEISKRASNLSTESIEDSASNSNKNIKGSLRNSSNISMKPPSISTVIVNVKNKNMKAKGRKNPIHIKESSSPEKLEENYCFSQEYSFHENKIGNERKKLSDDCSNLPLKIRRSGRKKNEKTAEKNIENVMFTGFADKKAKSLVNVLGGQIVESPFTCTVLVTDKIRRTTKFLSALSRGLPIVSPQWLIDSNENGKFLDANDFLLSDDEAERKFSFNLKKSIKKAQNGKVLDGWAIFITPSVKPSPEEMKSIIECSGGRFLSKELIRWPANSLIVSCNEDRAMWPKFSKKGKTPIIVDNEAILLGVLRQELDLESHKLL